LTPALTPIRNIMINLKHPRLYLVYAGIILIVLAIVGIFTFKIVKPKILAIITPTPSTVILQVPFSTQAPNNNWSRNEDCEETSITMANAFLTGTTEDKIPVDAAQQSIDNLKSWEQKNLGYNANTGSGATTKMAEGAFNLKVNQIQNFTEADLKTALENKTPILLPIDAQILGNTQYANGGPLYHMIVIRGFKGDTFIVNDPGTDNGDGNEYPFSVLQKASADWSNTKQAIDFTRKIALIISK